jgi:hypothetical protein
MNATSFNNRVKLQMLSDLREPVPLKELLADTGSVQDESWDVACLVGRSGIGGTSPVYGVADVVRRSVL